MAIIASMDDFVFQDVERPSLATGSSNDDPEKLKKHAMIRFTAELAQQLGAISDDPQYLKVQAAEATSRDMIARHQYSTMNLSTALEMLDPFEVGGEQDALKDKARIKHKAWLRDILCVPVPESAAIAEGSTQDSIEQEIRSYAELKKNWDGHGAARISSSSIEHILAFLKVQPHLAEVAEPFPDPNGNVGLEARVGDKVLYLSFAPSGKIAYLVRDGQAVDRGRGADSAKICNVLEAFF